MKDSSELIARFSSRLKDLMEEYAVTPDELGKAIGKNRDYIYNWRSSGAKCLPSTGSLIKLADYFKCSIDYLLGLSDENTLHAPVPAPPFHERFPAVTREMGYNFYRLAKETGMGSTNTYYSWVKEKYLPRIDSLLKICTAFDCSLDYLLGREN